MSKDIDKLYDEVTSLNKIESEHAFDDEEYIRESNNFEKSVNALNDNYEGTKKSMGDDNIELTAVYTKYTNEL